jgi:hypothetical protein
VTGSKGEPVAGLSQKLYLGKTRLLRLKQAPKERLEHAPLAVVGNNPIIKGVIL